MFLSLFKKETIPQGWFKGKGFFVWFLADNVEVQRTFFQHFVTFACPAHWRLT